MSPPARSLPPAVPEGHTSCRPADVTIAIVSHNHARYLDACLSSLCLQPSRTRVEVVVVDNVGEAAIAELVADRFPQARLIVNPRPQGFSRNNNQVILPSASRYSFLLNPDTVVRPGAMDTLVEFMDAHPDVGACGPKLVWPDGRLQHSCRRFPTLGAFLVRRTPLRTVVRQSDKARQYTMADWDHQASRPVDWLFGAAILIRRECLRDVGGLDEGMFLFSEDVDWCLRCWQSGWPIHYVPQAVVIHDFDDGKYDRYFTRYRWLHYRSMMRFVRKHWRLCLRW